MVAVGGGGGGDSGGGGGGGGSGGGSRCVCEYSRCTVKAACTV